VNELPQKQHPTNLLQQQDVTLMLVLIQLRLVVSAPETMAQRRKTSPQPRQAPLWHQCHPLHVSVPQYGAPRDAR
jgi:hypothetical protein